MSRRHKAGDDDDDEITERELIRGSKYGHSDRRPKNKEVEETMLAANDTSMVRNE